MSSLDLEVGDIVQISNRAMSHLGELGVIIGISYAQRHDNGVILYTVQFPNKTTAAFTGIKLRLVKKAEVKEWNQQ